jgi:hypothetical protein
MPEWISIPGELAVGGILIVLRIGSSGVSVAEFQLPTHEVARSVVLE